MSKYINNIKLLSHLWVALFLFFCIDSTAQNTEFTKENFPDKKDELKEAKRKLEIGEDFFKTGKQELIEFRRSYFNLHFLP